MKISSKQIRKILAKQWPHLEYIWLWDNTYFSLPLRQAAVLLKTSRIPDMRFVPLFSDCDNFALQFLAETRRKRYLAAYPLDPNQERTLPVDQEFPVTMGFAFGNLLRGMAKLHAVNIFIDNEEKIHLIDTTPMEKRIWEATDKDNILFVFM